MGRPDPGGGGPPPYAELHLHTNYSLLEGASHPEELIDRAAAFGYHALAVTDRDNLCGALVFARACRARGIQPVIGVELTTALDPDGPGTSPGPGPGARHPLTLLATSRQGYANLCRLVSLAHGHAAPTAEERERRRRDPCLPRALLAGHAGGLVCLTGGRSSEVPALVEAGDRTGAAAALSRLTAEMGGPGNVYVELHHNLVHGDLPRNRALVDLGRRLGVQPVATGDVHYHDRSRHRLHDVLCAIRHRTTLDESHQLRRANGELYLRPPEAQARRFARWPEAVGATLDIAERCAAFDLTSDLGYRLPTPPVPAGHSPDSWLAHLCREALAARYREGERPAAARRLHEELSLVARHGLAGFFLVYHEVLELAVEVAAEVRGASPRGRVNLPPGRGRGSSVGSVVCYLIGLSHIDPVRNHLFLGRFLNEDMTSLPDIDLDFPRDIRDRLFRRVYEHWGPDHAALVAAFPRYRVRSAVRDVGKVLGLPASELDRLAKWSEGYGSARDVRAEMERSPQFAPLVDAPGWSDLIALSYQLADFPRHVSQHVGGVVISSEPLVDCVPVQPAAWPGRYVCQWDKDSVDDAGMVKIDVLALGMLSLVEEALDLVAEHHGDEVDLSRIDFSDPAVYRRIERGDTVGVFQIESRAQAAMLPRTRPENLDDLAAQVAIIRPGPIVGGAVHPYVARRQARRAALLAGLDPPRPEMPHECVRAALEETLGVVLYQEQVLQVAMAMGGFGPGEAEAFRRTMSRRDALQAMAGYRDRFLAGARDRGVPPPTAGAMFTTLSGFAQFGFPKSHATAFALLAYQSAWLKEHYPAAFYCALLNSWPMGFYPPHVLTGDARRHGVPVRRPDVNASRAACTLEEGAVRLGLSWVHGLGRTTAEAVADERDRTGPYRSLRDLTQRTELPREAAENAILVGALDGLGMGRRELLWQLGLIGMATGAARAGRPRTARARPGRPRRPRQLALPLPTEQDEVALPGLTPCEAMAVDYEVLGLSPDAHPMSFLRPELGPRARSSAQLASVAAGARVETAGLVVCRQRPATAQGVVFLLLEDEHGLVSVMLSAALYEAHRVAVRTSPLLCVDGVVDGHAGDVAQIRARTLRPLRPPAAIRTPDGRSWA
ncbi:MAG: DNA polymerase III subunit alpha [Acidimicrobiales bacterium]